MNVRIVPTETRFIEGVHRVLGAVALERKYIGFVEPPPLDGTRVFLQSLIDGAGVQRIAITDADDVVGWCDIVPHSWAGMAHSGRLGMGLLEAYRGQGLGRKLVVETMAGARARGIERVELDVFASNTRAIRLYELLGFAHEGVRRRARYLDGRYDDIVQMAHIVRA